MKKKVIFFLLIALLTDTYSKNISVQPGPVTVKQGDSVSLWCKMKGDSDTAVPINWQSPPNYRTRTSNCDSFVKEKYGISCAESRLRWYNITILDVQWADRGNYRCIRTIYSGIVDLQVLVPVTSVSLMYISNITKEPRLLLSEDISADLTCTTNCAFPAPRIEWFENEQPFNGSANVNSTEVGCTGEQEGQERTISTVTVSAKYVDKKRKESLIVCIAENVIGEPKASAAITINYDVAQTLPQPVMSAPGTVVLVVVPVLVIAVIAIVIIIVVIVCRKRENNLTPHLNCFRRGSANQDVPRNQSSEILPLMPQETRTWKQLKKLNDVHFPEDRPCKTVCRIKHLKNGATLATLGISKSDENDNADTIYFHDTESSTLTDIIKEDVNPTDDVAVLSSGELVAPAQKQPIIREFTLKSGAFRDIILKHDNELTGKLRYIETNDSGTMFVINGYHDNNPRLCVVKSNGDVIQLLKIYGGPLRMAFCTQNSILYIVSDRKIRRFRWEKNSLVKITSSEHPDEEFECKDVCVGSGGEVFVTGRLQSYDILVYQMVEEKGKEGGKFLWKKLAYQDGLKRKGHFPRICSNKDNLWLGYHEQMERFQLV